MKNASLSYLTKEGLRNVWTNRLMSIASISVLMSCLVMIGLAFMALVNMESIANDIEDKNVIIAYMPVDATDEQIQTLDGELTALSNVKSVESVSKEQAFEEQRQEFGYSDELWAGLDENPLPQSFKITVENLDIFETTVEEVKALSNVEVVRENKEFAEQLYSIRTTVSYISLGIIALLLIVSLFIISNTIRITMFSRRLEISIMKSVGATRSFIRWPFMIEGVILGFLSGIFAFLLVWGIYATLQKTLGNALGLINFNLVGIESYALILIGAFVLSGIIAGGLGSVFSIGKYLKEQDYDVSSEQN